jgi:hypothetical protein
MSLHEKGDESDGRVASGEMHEFLSQEEKMKKIFGLLMVAAVVVFAAGTANAAFNSGDIIMVVDDTNSGDEYAQDLGSYSTLANGIAGVAFTNSALEADALSHPGSLEVFYFDQPSKTQVIVGATSQPTPVSALKFSSTVFTANGTLLSNYATLAGAGAVADAGSYTGASTYFKNFGGNYASLFNSPTALGAFFGSSPSLAMELYNALSSPLGATGTGIDITATIGTSGAITASISGAGSAAPIPPSVLLFVPGLLGLIGLKRRISA